MKPSSSSLNTNKLNLAEVDDDDDDSLSWFSEGLTELNEEDEDKLVEFEDGELNTNNQTIRNRATIENSENQKSLVDKAPGSLQHSFAHRTIPLPDSFEIRLFQFVSVFFICFMTAGIPFGLPALRQLLVEAGIYGNRCKCASTGLIDGLDVKQTSKRVGCSAQEGRLAIFQVSGWVSWMIGGWLAARSVQYFGPRSTGMIGCSFIMIGTLILAVSMPSNCSEFLVPSWLRMYIFPVMLMSLGSSFSFLACLHYVRLFPKRTSLLHSAIFLAQELSASFFYLMYDSREFISLRNLLLVYACVLFGQVIFWRCVYPSEKIPTIRFTVTTWHQRPLLVDKSLPEHISSPYFYLLLIFTATVFLKLYFYMCTFQVQLRILLIPTKRQIDPEDFSYLHNEQFNGYNKINNGTGTPIRSISGGLGHDVDNFDTEILPDNPGHNNLRSMTKFSTSHADQPKFFSHVPFFAEQPGGTSSNNVSLRQFIYNPMQPEIFLTDLQEMMYLLIPIASLITIFWMRSSMSDRKISTSLMFSVVALVLWGFVQ